MKMFVALAVFEHCPRRWLDSAKDLRAALDAAVSAGAFTCLGTMVVPFSPQGITACAIVSESHLALHSWPEEGRLFVDIASCSTREGVLAAIDAIAKAMPEGSLTVLDERVVEPGAAGPAGARSPG